MSRLGDLSKNYVKDLGVYICEICGKKYPSKSGYRYHVKVRLQRLVFLSTLNENLRKKSVISKNVIAGTVRYTVVWLTSLNGGPLSFGPNPSGQAKEPRGR